VIYIQQGNDILELSVTTNMTITETSDVTQHPVEAGSDIADNIVNRNRKFSYKGLVTNVKSYVISYTALDSLGAALTGSSKPNQKDVGSFFKTLKTIRDRRDVVKLWHDSNVDAEGVEDCVITNITYSTEPTLGGAYMVDLQLEKVRKSLIVGTSVERDLLDRDQNGNPISGGTTPTEEEDTQSLVVTLLDKIFG